MALDCTTKSLIFCLDKLSDKNEIEKVVYTEVMSPESNFFSDGFWRTQMTIYFI